MKEKRLTAYAFGKAINKQAVEVIRDIEAGKIRAVKVKIEKAIYQIPESELSKFK